MHKYEGRKLLKMKISTGTTFPVTDSLFLLLPKKNWKKMLDTSLRPEIRKEISTHFLKKNFKGEKGEILQIFPNKNGKAKKVFLAGVGELKEQVDIRIAASLAIRKAKKIKSEKVAFWVPSSLCLKRIVSGAVLGSYEFKIGDTKEQFQPKELTLITKEPFAKEELESERILAESTNFTRDLINLPPNKMSPDDLVTEAQKHIGKIKQSHVKIEILEEKELKKLGMGSLLAVGIGSDIRPNVMVLKYMGGKKKEAPIALVGKGVCFDSGGYNLKPTGHMEEMKSDMSGAATVLGVFKWLNEAKPAIDVVGVIGAVENLVSGGAYKPGDIITAMNGKTIEVTNTDAEGRLVLADCLYYAATKLKPAKIIDIATLTGACIAALGYKITGFVGNNKSLMEQFKKSANIEDEMTWEMPLENFMREKTKNDISDLKNWSAGVSAGTSMGGAFLENFVEKIPWIHIDIAGTAFHGKEGDELSPKGATGVMVRTLKRFIELNS